MKYVSTKYVSNMQDMEIYRYEEIFIRNEYSVD